MAWVSMPRFSHYQAQINQPWYIGSIGGQQGTPVTAVLDNAVANVGRGNRPCKAKDVSNDP
jgi:hypothetical protein